MTADKPGRAKGEPVFFLLPFVTLFGLGGLRFHHRFVCVPYHKREKQKFGTRQTSTKQDILKIVQTWKLPQ